MIKWAANYFGSISPVFLDGFVYFLIAICASASAAMSSDEAAKFVAPIWLFWIRTISGVTSAGLLAIKMYRSTSYAEHITQKQKDKENETKVPPFVNIGSPTP